MPLIKKNARQENCSVIIVSLLCKCDTCWACSSNNLLAKISCDEFCPFSQTVSLHQIVIQAICTTFTCTISRRNLRFHWMTIWKLKKKCNRPLPVLYLTSEIQYTHDVRIWKKINGNHSSSWIILSIFPMVWCSQSSKNRRKKNPSSTRKQILGTNKHKQRPNRIKAKNSSLSHWHFFIDKTRATYTKYKCV